MEMVAAARLRRAEERIGHLRPYAQELRKMTRQVPRRSGSRRTSHAQEHEERKRSGAAGHRDRGLAGSFNCDHPGGDRAPEAQREGKQVEFWSSAPQRLGVRFRGEDLHGDTLVH
jgi:F-type H+-transporting ATPase subunit gamma